MHGRTRVSLNGVIPDIFMHLANSRDPKIDITTWPTSTGSALKRYALPSSTDQAVTTSFTPTAEVVSKTMIGHLLFTTVPLADHTVHTTDHSPPPPPRLPCQHSCGAHHTATPDLASRTSPQPNSLHASALATPTTRTPMAIPPANSQNSRISVPWPTRDGQDDPDRKGETKITNDASTMPKSMSVNLVCACLRR
ncbi:hypothetical protein CONLIGDRAFT_694156 [Coniochaeta ligniaria NRRL 30616]|uniref:Uncharacterized protein n=1 Tax=Coniochaeta ligniaria NRRL 30616 TaxID=1408157 RepID=A0A1J7I6X4_9PEZI|nr:hypothetical protein CONLIGDRAFT_694156 [Coniochaeta ligniaria NRRL 30616]